MSCGTIHGTAIVTTSVQARPGRAAFGVGIVDHEVARREDHPGGAALGVVWRPVLAEEWLRRHRFDDIHLEAAFDRGFDAVLAATAARDRLNLHLHLKAIKCLGAERAPPPR
jgi:hypothetical protein